MTKTEPDAERIISCVNVAANALLAIRQIIVESDDPSVYAELKCELRIADVAISIMDDMLHRRRM